LSMIKPLTILGKLPYTTEAHPLAAAPPLPTRGV
jgi:hypothetical protein